MNDSKFQPLYEAAMDRFQRGGFLVGDRLEFKDGFRKDEAFKQLGDNVQEMLDKMIESGLNIRVTGIKNEYPSYYAANPTQSTGSGMFLDVALDSGGGKYTHLCTVPACLVEPISDGVNLSPIPDKWKRANEVQIEPKELEQDEEHITRQTDRGDANLSKTELALPDKNVKIQSNPVSPDPAVNSYMKAMANKPGGLTRL